MRWLRMLGIAVVLFGVSHLAHAYPTLTGPTGMAVLPTAEMAPGGFSLAADWQELDGGNAIPVRALLALGQTTEIGVMYTRFDDTIPPLDRMMGANLKFAVGDFLGGRGALGAQFLRLEDETGFEIDFPQAYFAWTTALGGGASPMIGLTWGVNWTRVEPDLGPSEDAFRAFGGVSVNIGRALTITGEIQSADSDLGDASPISAVTARFALGRNAAAQVGFTNALGVIGREDHDWFAGLSFGFGGGAGTF